MNFIRISLIFLPLLTFQTLWSQNIKRIHLENESVLYVGYSINFYQAMQKKLATQGIIIVGEGERADASLRLEIDEKRGRRFKKAEVKIILNDFNSDHPEKIYLNTKTCLMMSCSVRDFAKSIDRAIKKLKI